MFGEGTRKFYLTLDTEHCYCLMNCEIYQWDNISTVYVDMLNKCMPSASKPRY